VIRVLPYGDRAALVDLDRPEQVLGLHAALDDEPPSGTVEMVPAARTLLIQFDPGRTSFERLSAEITRHSVADDVQRLGPEVEVPVRYDGADLGEVARETGLTEVEVIRRHAGTTYAGTTYTVAFCGFAPGFGYLTGLDPALQLPRRATPRTRVPPGAVAIAGEYTAVYPRESPGGWRLIGSTGLTMWDVHRHPPNLLVPGTRVRFVERAG
jgi:KipI family sensor histidine kinase inhibitor